MLQSPLIMDYKDIQSPIQSQMRKSDRILHHCLKNRIRLVQALYQATPINEGKRIRSTFFYLLAGMTGIKSPKMVKTAAAIELLHLSSLIHDDIIDSSEMRRGKKTTSMAFGNHLSVLWGDFLYISALNLLRSLDGWRIQDVLTETSKKMIEGQILEFENKSNYALDSHVYFEIIRKKTASLFLGISRLLIILQEGPLKIQNLDLERFGEAFGMMFQIRDDLLDIFSADSGKDRFRDLQEGKVTLPYILFFQDHGQRAIDKLSKANTAAIMKKMKKNHVEEKVMEHIEQYARFCRRFVSSFPSSMYQQNMLGLIDFVTTRVY